jgi:cytochrome c oxidase assembly protein subunit 15
MRLNRFQKLAILTVAATLFLIFVGGLVRATGSGLGCPDWPKCYGVWVPPMHAADVPAGYDPAEFNAAKTWTEYVNRLIGVVIGLLIIATALSSLKYRKTRPSVTVAAVASLLLVLFQGWLGGMVVRSGLSQGLITAHMVVAMVLVGLLIFAAFKAVSHQLRVTLPATHRKPLLWAVWTLLAVSMVQLGIGTQVREAIDFVAKTMPDVARPDWLLLTGLVDVVHRSFSWLVLGALGWVWMVSRRPGVPSWVGRMSWVVAALTLLQIAVGIGLAYGGLHPALQVVHLSGVSLLISAQFVMLLTVSEAEPTSAS